MWIETLFICKEAFPSGSHPAWVCGLKLFSPSETRHSWCHTLRGCVDWNILPGVTIGKAAIVTPCVGVWIETRPMRIDKPGRQSHTLRGCVDWNRNGQRYCYYGKSHTLRGCVDWNISFWFVYTFFIVTPCVGVWIETTCVRLVIHKELSHTLRGCVDWNTILLY